MGLVDSFKEWWQKVAGGKADAQLAGAEQTLDAGSTTVAEAGSGPEAGLGAAGERPDGTKPDPGDESGAA
jgi:hypothetical protein